MRIELAGESAVIVYFSGQDLLEQNYKVAGLTRILTLQAPGWLVDWVPSYQSVLIEFDLFKTDFLAVKAYLRNLKDQTSMPAEQAATEHQLPVLYDHPIDNDLQRIASHNGVTVDEVIALHQSQIYRVFAVGFAPGFAFLGEVDERISTPRLATPRKSVPKGSVAIADRQTAVYPTQSPGGWNILGVCPSCLFEPSASPPGLLQVGDKVRFIRVSQLEFVQLGGQID